MRFTYYIDDDLGHLVRYDHSAFQSQVLPAGETKWRTLIPNNSYEREIFLGQGNNCLTKLSAEQVLDLLNQRYFEG